VHERPAGCAFANRCSRRTDICVQLPPLQAMSFANSHANAISDHAVACFHPVTTEQPFVYSDVIGETQR
jgi:ABC-type dipeptide/oligopeptide/nickel transport system ATPase component